MTAIICHACGAAPAPWRSKNWEWGPDPFLVRPVATAPGDNRPGLHAIISTHDPIVPALCDRCVAELREIHDVLEGRR
jgi:hypothetical protein